MSPLEHRWREFLAGHPEVRAMPGEQVTKIKSVWLDGASSAILVIAGVNPSPELEELKATIGVTADEIAHEQARAHGREEH